jgi:GntR family transcriptional regulator
MAMRLWLAKTGEVSLREQLTAQIILGITSRDLAPGQRLPSTRELARRYGIHANTVSAAYRDLARRGWVQLRPGSGIYVRTDPPAGESSDGGGLDQLVVEFLNRARRSGFSDPHIRQALEKSLSAPPPDRFLVIEPDPGLREILLAELSEAVGCEVRATHPSKLGTNALTGAISVALVDELNAVRDGLPAGSECLELRLSSVPEAMLGAKRPDADAILAVVSKWPEFLQWARTMLLAVGIDAASIITRDPRRANWERGLKSAHLMICDLVSARLFADDPRVRIFRIVAEDSLAELRAVAKRFGS